MTPVSQSQGFISVWPLAATAHGKYHMTRNLPCVRMVNISVVLIMGWVKMQGRSTDRLACLRNAGLSYEFADLWIRIGLRTCGLYTDLSCGLYGSAGLSYMTCWSLYRCAGLYTDLSYGLYGFTGLYNVQTDLMGWNSGKTTRSEQHLYSLNKQHTC